MGHKWWSWSLHCGKWCEFDVGHDDDKNLRGSINRGWDVGWRSWWNANNRNEFNINSVTATISLSFAVLLLSGMPPKIESIEAYTLKSCITFFDFYAYFHGRDDTAGYRANRKFNWPILWVSMQSRRIYPITWPLTWHRRHYHCWTKPQRQFHRHPQPSVEPQK